MARRISIRLLEVLASILAIREPFQCVIRVNVFRVVCHELLGDGPQSRDGFGGIVDVDCEAVGFVVVLHVSEDVVIDVAEEMDVRFYTPVIACILQSGMLVEHARIPTTHLVITLLLHVLHFLLFEDLHTLAI